MWRLAKENDVMSYEKLQEFVFMVTEAIPGLMNQRQRAQLILGLRARVRRGSAPREPCCRLTFSLTILCRCSWFWSFAKAQLGVLSILKRSRAIWVNFLWRLQTQTWVNGNCTFDSESFEPYPRLTSVLSASVQGFWGENNRVHFYCPCSEPAEGPSGESILFPGRNDFLKA